MDGTSPMPACVPAAARAPLRPIAFAPVAVEYNAGPNGTTLLRSRMPLASFEPNLAKVFRAAVETAPARIFLAERRGNAWHQLRYEDARPLVDHIAAAFIERGLSAERPVMILSGNSVEHALLMLAGFCAGVPVAPISVAYSLQSQDFGKLKHIQGLLAPGLVYVADTGPFAKALAALDLSASELVAGVNSANLERVTPFSELAAARPTRAVDAAVAAIRPDTIAKFLFTSGSTAFPKGVINTHLMLTANQQQIAQIWPFLSEQPLVLVDWLPWNHTFGANHNFNMVLRHAGTLYIDGGKPVPALIGETVRNLSEISPTVYFNVPAGYGALLPYLEKDEALARTFFAQLRLIFYAGAALPQDMWSRLEAVAARVTGERIPMTSSWGTTETSPLSTAAHFLTDRAGVIGVPVPGVELKLVPSGDKQEIRVRGPNVTPGYWKSPELTAAAFDADGFYRPGDAVRFRNAADPAQGLLFDGRLAEDFKLQTGTWVNVGALRIALLAACSPLLQDAVIAGADREYLGLLAWLNPAGCRNIAPELPHAELVHNAHVRAHLVRAIGQWNAEHPGLSTRIVRVLLLGEPPSIDANEITDKGYINQRLVLERRKADVERLFATPPDADVIVICQSGMT
ncbi:MAG TPA: feruloyl-CoA synthase [Xanthobacteraceae bacterium]|nr:feruloyl-CoA synthase [Xanthobacteraceae bacterium]